MIRSSRAFERFELSMKTAQLIPGDSRGIPWSERNPTNVGWHRCEAQRVQITFLFPVVFSRCSIVAGRVAPGGIRRLCQGGYRIKECLRLTEEQLALHDRGGCRHGACVLLERRPNPGASRKIRIYKRAGLRKDQVRLELLAAERGRVEGGERHTRFRVRYTCQRLRDCVSGLFMPHREVVYFDSDNAHEDSQKLRMRHIQAEVRVDAGARLLERRTMKSGRVRNRLHTALPPVSRRCELSLLRRGASACMPHFRRSLRRVRCIVATYHSQPIRQRPRI